MSAALAAAELRGARAMQEADASEAESFGENYPLDVFIEPPAGEHGATVDACSARACRHASKVIAKNIRALSPEQVVGGTCSQCGQPFSAPACGPTHIMLAHERKP